VPAVTGSHEEIRFFVSAIAIVESFWEGSPAMASRIVLICQVVSRRVIENAQGLQSLGVEPNNDASSPPSLYLV
jgi:hypothetical protein